MRYVAHLAALLGLGAFGVAAGDWVSHPNLLGAAALVALVAALALALSRLYGRGGVASGRPAAAAPARPAARTREPEPEPAPARRPERDAPLWADAGWGAEEAEAARERRRGRRRR